MGLIISIDEKPTKIGTLNYPETDGYYNDIPCQCNISCISCIGGCGCDACSKAYKDVKSEIHFDNGRNHSGFM